MDQNNPEGKKYGSKRLKQFLNDHNHLAMDQQKKSLMEELHDFRQQEDQRDDITIMGLKINPLKGG